VYTGLAINQAQTQLYAARAGGIDVFNSSFQLVNNGAFTTPAAISAHKLVPFNVQTLNNGDVAVTYAPEGRPAQIAATPGQGAVPHCLSNSRGYTRCRNPNYDRRYGAGDGLRLMERLQIRTLE
jgi:hypothetical protein